jgi:5-methylcytosine-specific restriction protein A
MSQKEDKQRIYNSREWHILREAKLEQEPLCERCKEQGLIVSATCVHHKVPIETAHSYADMRALAFCSLAGLQSLCYQCHSDIHKAMRSRSKEGHKAASEAALQRWAAKHEAKGNPNKP